MVQEWIVKTSVKSVQFRKQPQPDSSEQNVLGILKAGESVQGEFLFIRPGRDKCGLKLARSRTRISKFEFHLRHALFTALY